MSAKTKTRTSRPRSGTKKSKLAADFYDRPTDRVAHDLIGCLLCRRLLDGTVLKTKIVETEAYVGAEDRACHAYGNRRTKRTETLFGAPGIAYVFLIYGMYECLNAVTRAEGEPQAVLIRGGEPIEGHDFWEIELPKLKPHQWLQGPGRLCRALRISKAQNGISLQSDELWIEARDPKEKPKIAVSPRIGVDYAGSCAQRLLRYYDENSASVSGKKSFNREWIKSSSRSRPSTSR